MTTIETLRSVVAPPHPAGRPFIIGGILVGLLGLFVGAWLFWLGVAFLLFCLFSSGTRSGWRRGGRGRWWRRRMGGWFRWRRRCPRGAGAGVGAAWRVATFLSVLNVHVNRVPVDGTVTRIAYRSGAFVNASLDKASEGNERNALAIRMADGRDFAVVQIAGLIARRIVCGVREGEVVRAGARFGIIRFGSRTDLYLPEGVVPLVAEGQTMIGGETVIAELGSPVSAAAEVDEMGLA